MKPKITNIEEFDAHKVRNYLDKTINGFMKDPPDTNFQKGFLAAVLVVWEEALGKTEDGRVKKLEEYCEI